MVVCACVRAGGRACLGVSCKSRKVKADGALQIQSNRFSSIEAASRLLFDILLASVVMC
jgi:hypothetical protein